jgi:succinate dehydrogenase/fumarate reductase flavoprotein subunit
MDEFAKVFSTDVLVIGGGIAALSAANRAVDQGVEVLIADKSTAGWSGQAPLSGGMFVCLPPDKVEIQIKYLVEEGEYLNDQEFTETCIRTTYPFVQEMDEWIGPIWSFDKDLDGKLKLRMGGIAKVLQREIGLLPMLLGRVLRKGAKVLNKVYMVDLLKQGSRVVGAVGFHYQTGDFYVVQSKATILACGGCMYKSRPLFHTNCGEGVAMAYNAGAELRNAEFANMFHVANKYTLDDVGTAGLTQDLGENVLGENLLEKYPEINPPKESTPPWMRGRPSRIVHAMFKEIEAGRGPIYLDLTRQAGLELGGDQKGALQHNFAKKMQRVGIDITKEKVEMALVPEFHGGPIRVDLNCKTTLPGVYAAGDIIMQGAAGYGAMGVLPGGNLLPFAMVTGFWAGTEAGKAAATIAESEFSVSEVKKLKGEIFAPLGVKDGYNSYDAIQEIQDVVFKLKNSFVKHKDRLENALAMIEEVKGKLVNLMAEDSHELVRCHEAKSMVTNAELLYKASLMREETRGTHVREDYPERDDRNWLKWINIRKEDEKMKLWIEPIPIERYKYKPI